MILLLMTSSSNAVEHCQDVNYRAFDFWLGNWQVTSASDNIIRFNHISKINHGCTILEEYSSPSGYIGKSLNIYDQQSKQWHQTWTDSAGLLLKLHGGIEKNSMVMRGQTMGRNQQVTLNKITWTPKPDGSVRQHWQTSQNHGKTWQTAFDGLYRRVVTKAKK
ncbi:MAG: hypothetical protein ACPG52_05390 [Cognaticolwellia sp.]